MNQQGGLYMVKFDILKLGKIIEKLQGGFGVTLNKKVTIKSSKWILDQSRKYEGTVKRKLNVIIKSNIKRRISYPQVSRAIDGAIDELLKNGKYSINNMLVIKNPYQYAPLCALILFKTKNPYSVRVTVKGKTSDFDIRYESSPNTVHRIPVMGLYSDYENTIVIELLNQGGSTIQERSFQLKTDALKGNFSRVKVSKKLSNTKYLYNLTLVYGGGEEGIYPYAFDRNGDIRFYFTLVPKTYGFQPISGGKFLFLNKRIVRLTATNPTSTQMMVVDQMGRFHKTYNIEKGAHHDFAETKDGNFVVGSNAIDGNTFEDSVLEIDKITGNVLKEIKIKDYLDPKYVDTSDWAHLNTIDYNEDEKTVMVCLRNLHTVLKINYEKKKLVWIFAHPELWKDTNVANKVLTPEGDNMKWFFQAHASYFIDADLDGNPETKHIIIYDNHVQKRRNVSYFDHDKNSYVRIYTINEKKKTVRLLKSYALKKSSIRSNAVFEREAGKIMAMSGKISDGKGKSRGEIAEIDYKTGEVLNLYSMNHGYYRAYEFQFDFHEMAKSVNIHENYFLGKIYEVKAHKQIDISQAKELPKKVLEKCYKNEAERSKKLSEMAKKNPEYYVNPIQDMVRIKMKIEDDVLYVTMLDHLLEGIFFVGKEHTYLRDFSETHQERPEYFARTKTIDSISLNDFESDCYKIYYKCGQNFYKTKYVIEINRVRNRNK